MLERKYTVRRCRFRVAGDGKPLRRLMTQLQLLDEPCTAVKNTPGIREASRKLGTRLIKIFQPLCNSAAGAWLKMPSPTGRPWGITLLSLAFTPCVQVSKPEPLRLSIQCRGGHVTNSVKTYPARPAGGTGIIILAAPADRTTGAK